MNYNCENFHEQELILCCSHRSIDIDSKNKIRSLVLLNLDWELILKIAMLNNVAALLYVNLSSTCPEYIPDYVLLKLKTIFDTNTQKNLLILGEFIKIMEIFRENEVPFIPYKGILLSIMMYGGLHYRQFGDIDIFINKNDFQKAKNVLIANNYLPQYNLTHNKEDLHLMYMHEFKFTNKLNNISVELQWEFSGICSHFQDDINKYIQNIEVKSVLINNNKLSTFSDEDLIVILCIHAAGHLWGRLLWICDINEVIRSNDNLDWEKITKITNQLGIERILHISLILANELLETSIPKEIHNKIIFDKSLKRICLSIQENFLFNSSNSDSIINGIRLRYNVREHSSNGIGDAISPLLDPSPEDWKIITLPKFLAPFYYLLRIIRLLFKYNIGIFRLKIE